MRFNLQFKPGKQGWVIDVCKSGLKSLGVEYSEGPLQDGEVPMLWSMHSGEQYLRARRDFVIFERGYIGDRFKFTSIGLNGLNGLATFPELGIGEDRFNKYHSGDLKDWDPQGDYVLICGQVPGDKSLRGMDIYPWYVAQAKHYSRLGHRVIFRAHPIAKQRGYPTAIRYAESSSRDLEDDLRHASLVITFNSNSGVDALMAGKISMAHDSGSMVYNWDGTEEGRIKTLRRIAECQWLPEEIESGEALKGIVQLLESKNG